MNRKKILFYNKSISLGGQERMFVRFLTMAAEAGYDIDVIVGHDRGEQNFFAAEIPDRLSCSFLVPPGISRKIDMYRTLGRRFFPFKLVYSLYLKKRRTLRNRGLRAATASADYGAVVDLGSDFPDGYTSVPVIRRLPLPFELIALRDTEQTRAFRKRLARSFVTIVTSESMKTLALSAAPDMADRVRRVYNPLDIEDIRRKAAQTDGICAGDRDLLERKYLIMASRLDERQKDISSLLGAYGRVKDRIPEDLCILGSGADRERLEQRAAALGCGSRVVFPGRKNNPYPWLANATAVVHSSRLEGFPNVLLEALALGKAILATDCKLGPAEILDNGMCGLLRDVGDVDGMAEGLERLVTDSELRRGLERKAVERAKIFDAARVKDDFLQILEQALTRGAGSRM